MTVTNAGFDGTVDEARLAKIFGLTGVDAVSGWQAIQGTGRSVDVTPGDAFAKFVHSISDANQNVPVPNPVSGGAWHLLCRSLDWQPTTGTCTLNLRAGATTTATVPTQPPAAYPAGRLNNPGVLYDQPLAWLWVNSANTTVTIFNIAPSKLETRLDVGLLVVVPDLDALYQFEPRASIGATALVAEGGAQFIRRASGKFEQSDVAQFADLATRNTAYNRAGGVYKVPGALVKRADVPWVEDWISAGVVAAGWFPVRGIMPAAKGYRAAAVAVAHGTFVAASFDTIAYKTLANMLDLTAAPSRLYAPAAGLYRFTGTGGFGPGASGRVIATTRKNGGGTPDIPGGAAAIIGTSNDMALTVSVDVVMAAGDYLEMYIYQESGAARSTSSANFALLAASLTYLMPA